MKPEPDCGAPAHPPQCPAARIRGFLPKMQIRRELRTTSPPCAVDSYFTLAGAGIIGLRTLRRTLMANDRPGGDWRHSSGGSPPPARSSKTSRRTWQPGGPQTPATPGKARSRGGRLLVAGAVTGALAGLVVLLIWLFWPARYPRLVLVGATTTDSLALPENAAGVNGASELTTWAGEGRERDRPQLVADPAVTVDAN